MDLIGIKDEAIVTCWTSSKEHISRIREDKHVAAREKYAREFAGGGKPTTPAPNPTAAAPDANPKAKAKATPQGEGST